jgi:hypothetical protein
MLEVLAEQTRMQIIEETQHEIELILQQLTELEKHRQLAKPVSRHEEPTTLGGIVKKAEDQATIQGLSQKKKWLLVANNLKRHIGLEFTTNRSILSVASSVSSILVSSLILSEKLSLTNTRNHTNQK